MLYMTHTAPIFFHYMGECKHQLRNENEKKETNLCSMWSVAKAQRQTLEISDFTSNLCFLCWDYWVHIEYVQLESVVPYIVPVWMPSAIQTIPLFFSLKLIRFKICFMRLPNCATKERKEKQRNTKCFNVSVTLIMSLSTSSSAEKDHFQRGLTKKAIKLQIVCNLEEIKK